MSSNYWVVRKDVSRQDPGYISKYSGPFSLSEAQEEATRLNSGYSLPSVKYLPMSEETFNRLRVSDIRSGDRSPDGGVYF